MCVKINSNLTIKDKNQKLRERICMTFEVSMANVEVRTSYCYYRSINAWIRHNESLP